jgi:hypothetical protein
LRRTVILEVEDPGSLIALGELPENKRPMMMDSTFELKLSISANYQLAASVSRSSSQHRLRKQVNIERDHFSRELPVPPARDRIQLATAFSRPSAVNPSGDPEDLRRSKRQTLGPTEWLADAAAPRDDQLPGMGGALNLRHATFAGLIRTRGTRRKSGNEFISISHAAAVQLAAFISLVIGHDVVLAVVQEPFIGGPLGNQAAHHRPRRADHLGEISVS